jgi:hypothetical protein
MNLMKTLPALALATLACGAGTPPTMQMCTAGTTNACVCPNGKSGAQVCDALGSGYGTCTCVEPEPQKCQSGQSQACMCPDQTTSVQTCKSDSTFGLCQCSPNPNACLAGLQRACMCSGGDMGQQLCGATGAFYDCVCASSKRIFVTAATYSGSLGGIAGADAKCATSAAAANLPGTFKAWISDKSSNAVDRMADVGPWYLINSPIKAFNNRANLATVPLEAVNVNERGEDTAFDAEAWTGTASDGTKHPDVVAAYGLCDSWTQASYYNGVAGYANSTTSSWTAGHTSVDCHTLKHLYCVQQ